jgi:hypothetical protein
LQDMLYLFRGGPIPGGNSALPPDNSLWFVDSALLPRFPLTPSLLSSILYTNKILGLL